MACRSSRFSRSSALIRSRSSVVGPARTPGRARPDGPTCAAFRQSNRFWPRSTGSGPLRTCSLSCSRPADCRSRTRGKGWGMLVMAPVSQDGASESRAIMRFLGLGCPIRCRTPTRSGPSGRRLTGPRSRVGLRSRCCSRSTIRPCGKPVSWRCGGQIVDATVVAASKQRNTEAGGGARAFSV